MSYAGFIYLYCAILRRDGRFLLYGALLRTNTKQRDSSREDLWSYRRTSEITFNFPTFKGKKFPPENTQQQLQVNLFFFYLLIYY